MSDLKVGTTITHEGAPYQIIRAEHSKQARSAAVLRTKMRHVITGQVLEKTFQSGDTLQPADLERAKANYLYKDDEGLTFMNNQTFDQFLLPHSAVGEVANYVKEGEDVDVLYFEGKPVSVAVPAKVTLTVVESPPGVKGDSASNVTKKVKLETGHEVSVPLFVNQGDKIRINTSTGEYVERA
ncbi:MAG: elongation factor P [Candidatus Kerfeldbacteria bacterium]|nr:elongation factor P [Candidatus Kerfeldbacteria bacterium]